MKQNNFITYPVLFAGVLALSTSGIFAEISTASSAVTAFYRMILAAAVLTPLLLFNNHTRREITTLSFGQWKQILLAGIFLALHYLMWFESLHYTSVSSSIVLVALQPLFSLALDYFFRKRKPSSAALIGCIIAVIGSAVIGAGDFQISGRALFGDIISFLSAGVIALYYFMGESVRKEVSALTYSALGYYASGLILMIYCLVRGHAFTGYDRITWLSFIGLALISTICGQCIFNLLLKDIPASAVTMGILGEPVGTCILAYFLLQETIKRQQFLGMIIILIGMTIFFSMPGQKAKQTEKQETEK